MPKTIKGTSLSDLERAYEKILAWFYAYPQEEFSLNDIAKALDIAKTNANKIISLLEKERFLEIKILGKLWRIKANPKHPYFTTKKIPFNLQMVYESGIIVWINENIPNARAIVLFGSYRKGDDMSESDVDIAVEILGNEPLKIINITAKSLGYRSNVTIQIHVFSRNHIDLNLFANMANGIILQGFLEVRP